MGLKSDSEGWDDALFVPDFSIGYKAEFTGSGYFPYLDKIRQLCRDRGVQLVLIKAPSQSPVWWDQWDAQIAQYAAEHDLLYINMLPFQEEIGIDWSRDTYDAGLHLNMWGAEKLSVWLGRILSRDCAVPDRREDAALAAVWEEKLHRYETEKKEKLQ